MKYTESRGRHFLNAALVIISLVTLFDLPGSTRANVAAPAELAVTISDSPDPVAAGQNITYTISLVNNGPGSAENVIVTDAIPGNATFVTASVITGAAWTSTAPGVGGTGNVLFSKGTVAPRERATFQVVVMVSANIESGVTIANTVEAESDTVDLIRVNNRRTAITTVTLQASASRADLAVTITDSPDPVFSGNNVTYTINFINNGPDGTSNVTVTGTLPANTTFVSATVVSGAGWAASMPPVGSLGNPAFSKGSVGSGETAVFTMVVKVNPDAANGATLISSVTAATSTTDAVPDNNTDTATTTVQARADLAVSKTDSPDPVCVAGNITYTVNLLNNGPGSSLSTTVTDAVPSNTTFVSATVINGTGWGIVTPAIGGTGNVSFSKGAVAAGEATTFQVVIRVNTGTMRQTVITSSATATSASPDTNTNNNTATATTTVDPVPPQINCPAGVTGITSEPGQTSATVSYSVPTATDNCTGVTVVCNPPPGSTFPVGRTTVTCTATDTAANTATCSFQVTLFDVCLQDDLNQAARLSFNSFTGEYIFCCAGTVYTGTGTVLKQGTIFTLQHTTATQRVTGRVDSTRRTGSASLQLSGVNMCSITDRDIRNNVCNCSS